METEIQRDILVVKILSTWVSCPRKRLSIDASTFTQYFPFLSQHVEDTVHDRTSGNIKFLIVNKETAIREAKAHYRLHYGTSLHRDREGE